MKSVPEVTSFKQGPIFNGQYLVIPSVHFNGKSTCIKQLSGFKGRFTLSFYCLSKIGLTVFNTYYIIIRVYST